MNAVIQSPNATAKASGESRLDFMIEAIKDMPDSNNLIAMRVADIYAETANLRPVDQVATIPLRNSTVRSEFAGYLDEMLGAREILTAENFQYLAAEFLAEKYSSDPSYMYLTPQERVWVKQAVDSTDDAFQQAFSDILYDLSESTMPTPIQGMQTFCSLPGTLDEAFHCYEMFCADAQFAPLISNLTDEGRYATFRVARLARGTEETPESTRAIQQLANFLDLAA